MRVLEVGSREQIVVLNGMVRVFGKDSKKMRELAKWIF